MLPADQEINLLRSRDRELTIYYPITNTNDLLRITCAPPWDCLLAQAFEMTAIFLKMRFSYYKLDYTISHTGASYLCASVLRVNSSSC